MPTCHSIINKLLNSLKIASKTINGMPEDLLSKLNDYLQSN